MCLGPWKNQQKPLPEELCQWAPRIWVFSSAYLNLCSLSWLAKKQNFLFFLTKSISFSPETSHWWGQNTLQFFELPGLKSPHCFLFCFVFWHAWPSLSSVLSHSDSITYNNKRYLWHQQRRLAALGCITPYLSNYTEINKSKLSLLLAGQKPHKHTAEEKQLLSNSAQVNCWFFYSASSVKKFSPK